MKIHENSRKFTNDHERPQPVHAGLTHLLLLFKEIMPAVVLDEEDDKHKTYGKRGDSSCKQPFPETSSYLILYAERDEITVEDERPVHPAEFISDGENCQQEEDGEGILNYISDQIDRLIH